MRSPGDVIDACCWMHDFANFAGSCPCLGRGPWRVTSRAPDGWLQAVRVDNERQSLGVFESQTRVAG